MQPNNPMMPQSGMPPMGQQPYQQPPYQPQTQAQMKHSFNKLIIPFILVVLLLIGAIAFGVWAYMERTTYKTATDKIVAKEVELAKQQVSTEKDKEFVEKEKIPTQVYKGPATFGSIELAYPKTWSAYVTESDTGSKPVDGYLHPDFVPGVDSGTAFALRVEVVAKGYDAELESLNGLVKGGKVTVTPYRAEQVPDVLGARVEGEINKGQKDVMVLFPLRDKTLKISTQSETFYKDYNDIILKSLKFSP